MLPRGLRSAAVLAAVLGVAWPAAAAPAEGDRARLPALLRAGADAARKEDWKGCVDALHDALAIEDAARTAGDLGLCEEQAGRFGDAFNHLARALAAATPDMRRAEPWKTYQASVLRLSAQVALVTLTVDPTDALVLVDGRPIGKADGRTIALGYGEHTVVARAAGYEDARETRVVTPAGTPNIHLTLPRKAPPAAPPPAASPSAALPAPVPAPSQAVSAPTAPVSAPSSFPCWPEGSPRGVLGPLACAATTAFVVSAATNIGLTAHAESMHDALQARGFQPHSCAPGQPAAGSSVCMEITARAANRHVAGDVMIGSGVAAAVLGAAAALAIMLDRRGPTLGASVGAAGAALTVQGSW